MEERKKETRGKRGKIEESEKRSDEREGKQRRKE